MAYKFSELRLLFFDEMSVPFYFLFGKAFPDSQKIHGPDQHCLQLRSQSQSQKSLKTEELANFKLLVPSVISAFQGSSQKIAWSQKRELELVNYLVLVLSSFSKRLVPY